MSSEVFTSTLFISFSLQEVRNEIVNSKWLLIFFFTTSLFSSIVFFIPPTFANIDSYFGSSEITADSLCSSSSLLPSNNWMNSITLWPLCSSIRHFSQTGTSQYIYLHEIFYVTCRLRAMEIQGAKLAIQRSVKVLVSVFPLDTFAPIT